MRKAVLNWISSARRVQAARRSLFAALSDPEQIPSKAAAYAAEVRRHREQIFTEALRGGRPAGFRG